MQHKHTLVGLAFLMIFLATGAYMEWTFPSGYRGDLGMRLMFRSAHLYILLSALINVVVGVQPERRWQSWRKWARLSGSGCLMAAPALFTAAFFIEPTPGSASRPITLGGAVLILAGAFAYCIPSWLALGTQKGHQ